MRILTPVLLSSLFLFGGCGDKTAAAGNPADATKDAAAKQMPAFDSLKGSLTTLNTTLAGITDVATAEKAKGTLEGLVTTLKTQMATLGGLGKLPESLVTQKASLVKTANDLIARLLGNAEINTKIGAVLKQLQDLLK